MKELDYIEILKSLQEIPFGIGKKLLIEFLQGNEKNESIIRNKLFRKQHFGALAYSNDELSGMIDNLVLNGMIQLNQVQGNKFWKVMELSDKGKNEIILPSLYKKKLAFNAKENKTIITEEDKLAFKALESFLIQYNDEQKKAIISNKNHILCIAGAGSGKTTVLTKRIEFLINYKSIDPKKILAITFTRKARQEMIKRLGNSNVMIETFNSFCEMILRKNSDKIDSSRVINYKDKILMINSALARLDITINRAIDIYFTFPQKRSKTDEQLANIFMNDCFFIRDYFKFKNKPIHESSFDIQEKNVRLVISVCRHIEEHMKKERLRDFADQLIDTLELFSINKESIPQFDHVLVDEYQDVNSTQIQLLDMLAAPNIFCVGDPRQSIYGWRGSDIRYILQFEEKYKDAEIITLTKNYRSTNYIVDLINNSIRSMGLIDLESATAGKKDLRLFKFDSEEAEYVFIMQVILGSTIPKNDIFVLARTNRQLNELSKLMIIRGIRHIVRSDEIRKTVIANEGDITLATIHAIKGLEAKLVFVMGCNGSNFPCKASEHPVIEMVRVDEYDKEEEERRLFYVAMSRAKESLYLTYSGKKPTSFITETMMASFEQTDDDLEIEITQKKPEQKGNFKLTNSNELIKRLKEWRKSTSESQGLPAYIIMHDKTLFDIAMKIPMEKSELEQIYGLGPTKIMKYGDEILRIVNNL